MTTQEFLRMREVAREAFAHTLTAIALPKVLDANLEYSRGLLRIGEDLHDLPTYSRVFAVSMGKAAYPMAEALATLAGQVVTGIVVASHPPQTQMHNFRYFLGGHPLPTSESLRSADAILRTLGNLDAQSLVIFMISGGASAMVEKPLDADLSLKDLVATYRALVLSGMPIHEMNAIRKHLSAVKGGRLAQAAYPAQQVSILVSDVPEHALDALASGPTMPDSSTCSDCYEIAEGHGLLPKLPAAVREMFDCKMLEETPKSDDPAFVHSRWWTILSSATAAKAAAEFLSRQGFAVEIDNRCDDWDYRKAADYLLDRLRKLRQGVSRACIVSAGEVTVKVDKQGGHGGRNQQFALYCAEKIAGDSVAVLSAGTDGIDGNSDAAGAIVDGSTMERARAAGLDPAAALRDFDSTPFFASLGDLIVTGPTGNNVRDLRVLLAW